MGSSSLRSPALPLRSSPRTPRRSMPARLQRALPSRLRRGVWFLKGWVVLTAHGVEFAGRPNIRGRLPQIENEGRMSFGPKFSILGRMLPAALVTRPGAELTCGYRVHLNHGVVIYAAERVTIGDYCLIGDMATIYDTSFHQLEPDRPVHTAPVVIGSNVWIARGAVILPGVTIGDGAVVAANAVVSKDVPPRTVVAGNPARPVGPELGVPDPPVWWRM